MVKAMERVASEEFEVIDFLEGQQAHDVPDAGSAVAAGLQDTSSVVRTPTQASKVGHGGIGLLRRRSASSDSVGSPEISETVPLPVQVETLHDSACSNRDVVVKRRVKKAAARKKGALLICISAIKIIIIAAAVAHIALREADLAAGKAEFAGKAEPGALTVVGQQAALAAVGTFSRQRALVPPRGSELWVLHYQSTVMERLIDARSLFILDLPPALETKPEAFVRREMKRALKARSNDIKRVSSCFNELGQLLHRALDQDRAILLHLAGHLREAYGALVDQDAAGTDMHAGLLWGTVADFEVTLTHVISTYSKAAAGLSAICGDLGFHAENAALTFRRSAP
eukprot:jgi/Botrbrau1/12307/Bobra.0205s0006.1